MQLENIKIGAATVTTQKILNIYIPCLKLTPPLKINGWKMNFPFGARMGPACFQGLLLSVSGRRTDSRISITKLAAAQEMCATFTDLSPVFNSQTLEV